VLQTGIVKFKIGGASTNVLKTFKKVPVFILTRIYPAHAKK
jgi:hypothetical protein